MKNLRRFAACLVIALATAVAVYAAFTLVQSSVYGAITTTTAPLTSNQTAGNTNLVGINFCQFSNCATTACNLISSVTDNAGSAGGSGNNTYVIDLNSSSSQNLCVGFARAVNITHTTSTNTVTAAVSGTPFYQRNFSIEVSGLGTSPTLHTSGINSSGAGLGSVSTTSACSVGDFAWAFFASTASLTAGTGWTTIGTPSTSNQVAEWQTVSSAAVVTATASGTTGSTGAAVVCYTPNSSSFSTQIGAFLVN